MESLSEVHGLILKLKRDIDADKPEFDLDFMDTCIDNIRIDMDFIYLPSTSIRDGEIGLQRLRAMCDVFTRNLNNAKLWYEALGWKDADKRTSSLNEIVGLLKTIAENLNKQ